MSGRSAVSRSDPRVLAAADRPLVELYDAALLDLDGVVYVDSAPVSGVPETLAAARSRGMRLAFVTNNASRRATEVADRLTRMGIPAMPAEVVTSAQAAARLIAERFPPGTKVLIVGAPALAEEIRSRGMEPVWSADERPEAVVQGWAAGVGWRQLAEAAVALQRGVPWIATNGDSSLPSRRGPVPGNGALIAALTVATGRQPVIVGKPMPELHRECIDRTGARHPLVVGDRLDTDIAGAIGAGADSLLVLSGVTDAAALLGAPPARRPTYLAGDLSGLLRAQPAATHRGHEYRCGAFLAREDGAGVVQLSGRGGDPLDALRALCGAVWSASDAAPAGGAGTPGVRATGGPAMAALVSLGLAAG